MAMQAIGPGDFVVATRSDKSGGPIREGAVYLCSGVVPEPHPCLSCRNEHGGLYIAGVRAAHYTGAWALCMFRPFHGPELEHLNRHEPVKEPA